MFKKLLNKYKNNRGEIGIETAAVMLIFVPIICTIIFGGYAFFTAQSKGIDLNYDTGRYVAMTGCSIEQLQEMDDLNKYASYSIAVREGENTQVLKADGSKGSITISCQPDSKKGDEFEVYTSMVVFGNTPIAFMPEVATRNGIYVQEQGDYHDYTPGAPTFAIDYVLNDSEEFPAELPEDAPHEYKMDRNTPLKNPSRYGYDFLGWYDNSSFTGERITYIPAGQTGDKTLYAKWEYTTRTYNVYYVSSASGIYLPQGSPVSSTITGQF